MTPPALVVLGSSIERTCRLLVAEAARTAARLGAEVVVLSGWGGEGELMRAAWRGPSEVELVLENTASTTAENAARSLPLLVERGVTEAVVICAPLHLLRARLIFRRVYERHGISVTFRAVGTRVIRSGTRQRWWFPRRRWGCAWRRWTTLTHAARDRAAIACGPGLRRSPSTHRSIRSLGDRG